MKLLVFIFGLLSQAAWSQIDIQQWSTKNGTSVLYVNAPDVPMLDIKVAFRAGSAYEGKNFGLSALTVDLLSQGNKGQSADEIADLLADSGAQINTFSTRDMAILSLRSLTATESLDTALTAFELVLNHPDFPSAAIKREKAQQIAAIKQSHESPNTLANDAFFTNLYGQHPYAHPVLGTIDTVGKLQEKQVIEFYQHHFVGKNATMAIVGDVSKQQAMAIAEQLTLNMKAGQASPHISPATAVKSALTQRIEFPSAQTAIRIGQLGITHHNPRYFPLMVGNYTLGGGSLVSRLAEEIREKRGLTYNVSSQFLPLPATGPFVINLATKTNQADEAIRVTLKTLKEFIANGPSELELSAAKQYLTGSFPLSLASNRSIASMLIKISFYKLPLDFLTTYTNKINAVKQTDIKQAFEKQLHPSQLIQISVGKTAALTNVNKLAT